MEEVELLQISPSDPRGSPGKEQQAAGVGILLQIMMLVLSFVLGHVLRRHRFYYLPEASASLLIGTIKKKPFFFFHFQRNFSCLSGHSTYYNSFVLLCVWFAELCGKSPCSYFHVYVTILLKFLFFFLRVGFIEWCRKNPHFHFPSGKLYMFMLTFY